eukprot:scaffold1189_cov194-Amphora_coffeaeformis.AAC.19
MASSSTMEQSQPTMTTTDNTTTWQVGQLVQVQARTWPGINQPGGVGRITGCNTDGTRVSVRYVLDGRHEKEIETIYLSSYGNDTEERLRDRSMLLGRCHNCGSLRSDCGSCDLRQQEQAWRRTHTQSRGARRRSNTVPQQPVDSSCSGSSSDDDSVDQMIQNARNFESQSRKVKRLWQRYRRYIDDESGSDEDEPAVGSENIKPKSTVTLHMDVQDSGSQDLLQEAEEKSVSDADDEGSSSSSVDSEEESKLLEALARTRQRRLSMTRQLGIQTPSKSPRRVNHSPTQSFSPPPESPELESQLVVGDSTDDPFIQPEGSADTLPADVRDASRYVPYTNLPNFIDSLVQRLETTGLPAARRKLVQLERQGRRALHDLSAADLEETHEEWIRQLVRGGIDQCQAALRKISSQYRRHKAQVPNHRRQEFRGAGMELRETRVDNLSRDVEEVMVRLRQLLRQVKGDDEDEEENGGLIAYDEDDGWADPFEESPIRRSDQSPVGSDDAPMSFEHPLDRHEHASRGRKAAATRMGRFVKKRSRKRTSQHAPPKASGRPQSPESHNTSVQKQKQDDDSSVQSSVDGYPIDFEFTDEHKGKLGQTSGIVAEGGRKRAMTDPVHEHKDESGDCRPKRSKRETSKMPSDFFAEPRELDRRAGPDQEPALKRMERFLLANGEDVEGELPPSSPESSRRRRPRMRQTSLHEGGKSGHTATSNQRSRQPNRHNAMASSSSSHVSMPDHLFSELRTFRARKQDKIGGDEVIAAHPTYGGISDVKTLCAGLRTEYGSPSGRQVLQKLSDLCRSKTYPTESDVQDVFSTLWACLKENGTNTVQFFVALHPRELPDFVRLHVALLDAMKGLKETTRHRVQQIMAPVVPSEYVQFVAMQLVDSILSLLLPKAWGVTVHKPTRILRHFDSLRRALGNHCNLLETCSECLLERLPTQQWRLTLDKSNAYISSIDPENWTTFLATGKVASETETCRLRYADIKSMHIPRCEADAIWGLLGFIGHERGKCNEEATCFRRLVSALFSRGPLLSSPDEQSYLPPSPFQTEACLKELGYVSALLKANSVNGSTMKDSILQNLIKQSVRLGADFVCGVEEARIELFPAFDKASGDWVKLKSLRKRSDVHMSNGVQPIPTIQSVNPGDLFSSTSTFLGQHEFLPSSDILRECLMLFVDWYGVLPAKRARYASFEKTKNILVKHFKDLGNEVPKQSTDAFQQAFSTNTPAQSGQGSLRKSSLYLEMAAYLEIFYALLIDSSNDLPGGVRPIDSLDLLSKIWNLLTDTVQDGSSSLVDPYHLYICAKAISFAGLLCEGILPVQSDGTCFSVTPESSNLIAALKEGDRRNYVLGRLIFCLEQTCSSSSASVEVICFILQRTAVYFDSTMKSERIRFAQSSDVFLVSHLEKLEDLCKRCVKRVISSSYCGSEEDICLTMALLVADFVASARVLEPSSTDEWGGLDDSLFASIDIEADTSNQVMEESLDNLLSKALLNSVPSLRYINHANTNNDVSVQGRLLVARRLKWIVRSLVLRSTVSGHKNANNAISCFWNIAFWSGEGENALDDLVYMKGAGFALVGEACQMWNTQLFQGKMITTDATTLVLKALEFMIDSSAVSRIPSQELSAGVLRGKSSRNEGAAKELMMYKDLQRGGLKSILRRCDRSWFVCEVIASATNFVNGRTPVFEAFRQALEHQKSQTVSSEFSASMEKELFRRLNFLLHILRLARSRAEFEIISTAVIGIASTEVAKSLQKLKSCAKSLSSHALAKETQMLISYSHLYASLITQVLLQGTSQELLSENVLSHLLDECLIPCLSRRKRAIEVAENNTSMAASFVNKMPPRIQSYLSNVPWDAHDGCIGDALRGRSTQIAMLIFDQLFMENNNTHQIADNLAWALVSSISDSSAASMVARGLFRGCGRTVPSDICGESLLSIEFEHLLMNFVPDESQAKCGNEKETVFVTYVLENVIAKKLRRINLKCDDRLRLLRLLLAVLKDLKLEMIKGWDLTLEPKTLASIGNTISISIWSALSSNEVDKEVLESSLLCASYLYGLPSRILSMEDFGWITDWCSELDEVSDLSAGDPRKYLGYILTLCTTICGALEIISPSSDSGNFLEYRKLLADRAHRSWAPFGALDEAAINSIMLLEKQLGFDVVSSSRQVNNVYAIRKGNIGMVEFMPDSRILSAARRFRNEIRRM